MLLNRSIARINPEVIADNLLSLYEKEISYSRRDRVWLKFVDMVSKFEKVYVRKLRNNLKKQEDIVLNNLFLFNTAKSKVKKSPYEFFLFDRQEWIDGLDLLNKDISLDIARENGERVLSELADFPQFKESIKKKEETSGPVVNFDFDIESPGIVEFIATYSYKLAITFTDEMMEGLRDIFQESFDLGETIADAGKKIEAFFKLKRSYDAERIARTELIRAAHQGAIEAYSQSGVVVAKEWLTGRDEKVCPWCSQMDGKQVELREKFYELGETLEVDNLKMSFDYSEITAPPLHPNCRCDLIPIVDSIFGF